MTQAAANTRLSGNWFISDISLPGGQAATTVQTLRLRYSDWDGNEQTVWLLGNVSELAEDAHSTWGPDLYDAQEIRELFPQELLLSCTNALHLLEQHHYSVSPTTLSID